MRSKRFPLLSKHAMSRRDRFAVVLYAMLLMASHLAASADEDLEERANQRGLPVLMQEEWTKSRSPPPGRSQSAVSRGTNAPDDGCSNGTTSTASRVDRTERVSALRGYDLKLYSALSRIAKVSLTDHENRRRPQDHHVKKHDWGGSLSRTGSPDFTVQGLEGRPEEMEGEDPIPDVPGNPENRPSSFPASAERPLKTELIPKKFHCHPVEDVYIPEIGRQMPAYVCKLGQRTFILSSLRFFEDYRPHVDVNVDEETLQRLTSNAMTPTNSMTKIIGAKLVLKPEESDYEVRSESKSIGKTILQGKSRGNGRTRIQS